MKKLIAILTIAIVLVGAVFADTADLHITTTITAIPQAFKLGVKSVATGEGKATLSSGADAVSVVTNAAPTKGEVVITTNDLLTKDATITFAVYQTAEGARKTQGYTLSATVGNLVLYALPAGTVGGTTPSAAQITANYFAADAPNATLTAVTNATLYTNGNAGTTLAIGFLGTPVAANTEIANFTCTWGKNANNIPGEYQADVVLTITADAN